MKAFKILGEFLGLAVLVAVSATITKADTVIYSNLGPPGNVYLCCAGYTTSGSSSPIGETITGASEFTSSGNYSVSQIDVAVGYVAGDNAATISLWTDSADIPGTQLGSWNVTGLPVFGTCCDLVTITGITGIDLTSGTDYFLEVASGSDPANNTWDAWNLANTATGLFDQETNGVWAQFPGSSLGAFDILGNSSSTPEPGSLILLGTGLIGVAGFFRRRLGL